MNGRPALAPGGPGRCRYSDFGIVSYLFYWPIFFKEELAIFIGVISFEVAFVTKTLILLALRLIPSAGFDGPA